MGAGPIEVAIVAEEIGRAGARAFVETVVLAGGLVAAVGTAEQKAELLGGISEGRRSPSSRTPSRHPLEPAAEGVTATQSGDGWTLTGVKEPVPSGARADVLVVSAVVEGGTGLFLVQGDASGLTRTGYRPRRHEAANVRFDGACRRARGRRPGTAAIERALAGPGSPTATRRSVRWTPRSGPPPST